MEEIIQWFGLVALQICCLLPHLASPAPLNLASRLLTLLTTLYHPHSKFLQQYSLLLVSLSLKSTP